MGRVMGGRWRTPMGTYFPEELVVGQTNGISKAASDSKRSSDEVKARMKRLYDREKESRRKRSRTESEGQLEEREEVGAGDEEGDEDYTKDYYASDDEEGGDEGGEAVF
mmetsp:Transcript_6593/g.13724  ORF Transcript_6593/g.13724 Transcript_6593/m.13724 type:complete len:109 (+) Transcript_6593:414-740(+)